MKKIFKILFILLFASAAAGITFFLNKSYINEHTTLGEVVVAKEDISPYAAVTNYEVAKVVKASIPEDAVTKMDFLKNKQWFTTKLGIGKGDIIRKSRIVEAKNNPFGPALGLKEGNVLVGVKTDQILSAGKYIKPDTLANAFVFIQGNRQDMPDRIIGPGEDPVLSKLLIKDVQNSDGTTLKENGDKAIPAVAVVEGSVNTAKKLVEYQEKGKVYFAPTGIDLASVLKIQIKEKQQSIGSTQPQTTPKPVTPINQPTPNPIVQQ